MTIILNSNKGGSAGCYVLLRVSYILRKCALGQIMVAAALQLVMSCVVGSRSGVVSNAGVITRHGQVLWFSMISNLRSLSIVGPFADLLHQLHTF